MNPSIRQSVRMLRAHLAMQSRSLSDNTVLGLLLLVPPVVATVAVVGHLPLPGYEHVRTAPGAFTYGGAFAGGDHQSALNAARGLSGVVFVVSLYGVVMQDAKAGGLVASHLEWNLLTSNAATVALSEFLKRLAFVSALVGPVVLFGAVAFGAGANAPAAAVLVLLGGAALLLTATAVGQLLSYAFRWALIRFAVSTGVRKALGGAAIMAATVTLLRFRQSMALLRETPLAGYADLGFAATPAATSPGAIAVAVATLGSVPLSLAVVTALGPDIWLRGPDGTSGSTAADHASSLAESLGAVVARPTASVVALSWVRAFRTPESLLYAVATVPLVATVLFTLADSLPLLLPTAVAIYTAFIFAIGVTLNPVGNEGGTLATTLTTPRGERTLVVGYALSAIVPGVVVAAAATITTGVLVGASPTDVLYTVVLGVTLATTLPFVSVGVGTAIPQYEGTRLSGSSGLRTPRFEAVLVLLVAILVLAQPAVTGIHNPGFAAAFVGLPALDRTVVGAGLLLVTVVAAAAAARLAYDYAVASLCE